MDGSALEHSDSDSGESWTLLDSTPTYADDAPALASQPPHEGERDTIEKDEDTDGISIISDSDPESAPGEMGYDQCSLDDPPADANNTCVPATLASNSNDDNGPVRSSDDLLVDSNGKLKTYVHRRNKRISTVLNIIVLGSVITAAGVAIGHMWGAKNECINAVPSVNKILSNLYKLQEENAYLRSKLKELTLANNIQSLQRKDKFKQQRCKKIFEESLDNKNANKVTKCLDNDYVHVESGRISESDYEKDFLTDIDKLKNVYQQNKSWLDVQISRRMKNEGLNAKKIKTNLKSPKSTQLNGSNDNYTKEDRSKQLLEAMTESTRTEPEIIINVTEPAVFVAGQGPATTAHTTITVPVKVSYADSVRSVHKIRKRDTNDFKADYKTKLFNIRKRKRQSKLDVVPENNASDDELTKDDRYVEQKPKPERKKNDRQKTNKKQKRRNKYEQWEMKGGYMKDYDDFSISSAHENEFVLKNPDKNLLSRDFEINNYINQFSEGEAKATATDDVDSKGENRTSKRKSDGTGKDQDANTNWFDKRAALRTEARKKVEQELFGDATPNNANWYFRRMQKREQCRVKGDSSTHRKHGKRTMNFKTKH